MTAPEILTATEADLPEIADYIHRTELALRANQTSAAATMVRNVADNLAMLRWQIAQNPLATEEIGFKLRSADGVLLGVHLVSPLAFRWQERKVLGLASCSFFVDPQVRLQAFYLFKRFLALRGFDFHFASSCNEQSGALWSKCGGRAVPNTDVDWLFPISLRPLVRETLLRKGWQHVAGPASWAAIPFDWGLKAGKLVREKLRVQQTEDLEFMAQSAAACANPDRMNVDRNVEYLRWMYVAGQAVDKKHVYRFEDESGRSGWFSISLKQSGMDGGIRLGWLLDWAVPHEPFDLASIVQTAARQVLSECDVLAFRLRPDAPTVRKLFLLKQFRHPGPKGYLIPKDRNKQGMESAIVMSRADAV